MKTVEKIMITCWTTQVFHLYFIWFGRRFLLTFVEQHFHQGYVVTCLMLLIQLLCLVEDRISGGIILIANL